MDLWLVMKLQPFDMIYVALNTCYLESNAKAQSEGIACETFYVKLFI